MSLKLKLQSATILETLILARKHQLPADPWPGLEISPAPNSCWAPGSKIKTENKIN